MKKLLTLSLLLVAVSFFPHGARAATLQLSPSERSMNTGDIVTLRVLVNSGGTAINNAEAVVTFPTDILQAISVSKGDSIFSLWLSEPALSNSAGTISFNGGIPNPGYSGGGGTAITMTFRAKRAGTATLTLGDAAVRANDGLGTDVLTGAGGSTITISDAAVTPTPVTPTSPKPTLPTQPVGTDAISSLTSATHPDQTLWYSNANPKLSWKLPDGATSVITLISSSTDTLPSVLYKPAISEKQIKDLPDGIWYFNIRAKTASGNGPISSYRLQIDTTLPTLAPPSVAYDPHTRMLIISGIHAEDVTSGIATYQLAIDGGTPVAVTPEQVASGTYRYGYRVGGAHSLVFSVFDKAGNLASIASPFIVPVPLLDQTLVTLYGIDITLLWFILLVLLLTILSLGAAVAAWYRLYKFRHTAHPKLNMVTGDLHRSFDVYKDDLEKNIKLLEKARTTRNLTPEEVKIHKRMLAHLNDLERYLVKDLENLK